MRYHHRPASGWVNDPLALTWHKDRCHLFFQHVPDGTTWRVSRAVPLDDDWLTWAKQNVVVTAPAEASHFRDPFVQRHGGGWRMLVGAVAEPDVGTAWAWISEDLTTWTYAGVLASRPATETAGTWTGPGWECPQLVEVDGREVLVVSVWGPGTLHYLAYRVGEAWSRLTYGPAHYAGSPASPSSPARAS